MTDYISREDVERNLFKIPVKVDEDGYSWILLRNAFQASMDATSADVVPVMRGKWVEHKNAEEVYGFLISNYECTCCHDWLRDITRYCPSCGADMRGAE